MDALPRGGALRAARGPDRPAGPRDARRGAAQGEGRGLIAPFPPPPRGAGGLDGCRAGWVGARLAPGSAAPETALLDSINEALAWFAPDARVGVDMPLGLPDSAEPGGRACDRMARALLGRRGASVFPPPVRGALAASGYAAALAANRASSPHGIGLSKQSHNLFPKIRELDAAVGAALQERVFEVHPEVAFAALNGGAAVAEPKKSAAGLATRMALLRRLPWEPPDPRAEARRLGGCAPDDVADALAVCATAWFAALGRVRRLPPDPPRDARGLRMEIVAPDSLDLAGPRPLA
ncbi:MAG: DUF429 domain-containing protein [Candidatus Sumerlaeia bacterium]|nr:DUF429 domain-containing protein [Candidatus Sumerlaeia bacterium]